MSGHLRTRAGAPRSALVTVLVAVVVSLVLGASTPSGAQQVEPAVADLRDHDVTFEDGALSGSELDQLDEATADLQGDGGYYKVVVLGDVVTRFDDARAFGGEVLSGLGGDGRVLVIAPGEVGLASNVDPGDEIDDAEQAAADALNGGKSLTTATEDAAGKLGVDGGGGGGGIGWFWILLLIALPLLAIFLLWRAARRMRQGTEAVTAEQLGTAETTVRTAVDKAANDLLELADRVDLPDAPAGAKESFALGAETFTQAQELLEGADTRPELERAYPTVVAAGWHLDTARALLDGQPAPAQPEPDDLFPPVVVTRPSTPAAGDVEGAGADATVPAGAVSVGVPQPHYRQSSSSPWITAAAMAAMTMLSQRGMRQPQTRPSMDDGAFGSWTGGLPPMPSSGRSRGGWFSGGGAGRSSGGSGGGGGFMTSGQRRRGMGRRA